MQELLGPLILFAAAMCLTPGPNVVMITAAAANFGFRRALPQAFGVSLGFAAMVLASGFGLAVLFQAEPRLHVALKYGGAAYLFFLAWRIAQARRSSAGAAAKPIGFLGGALVTWLNPKGWVTVIGALTAFTTVERSLLPQASLVAGVLGAACLISLVMWAALGTAIGRWLRDEKLRRAFNWSMAALLVLSLVPVFSPP